MTQEYKNSFRSPVIRDVKKNDERLIDTGMLHFESSIAGYNERYRRGETSHTIHVWWARRPHSAMRSLVFSSLCKEQGEKPLAIMANLAMSCDSESLTDAKKILTEHYATAPRVLDMFGGGGTIPFEAKRLGLNAFSIDSNQLSVFIQKCNMFYADKIDLKEAEEKVATIGNTILHNLEERTNWLYPLRKKSEGKVFGYIWTYRIKCPDCGHEFLLCKRPWLARKKSKNIGFVSTVKNNIEYFSVKTLNDDKDIFSPAWERYTGVLHCANCNKVIKDVDVLKCEDVMTAFIQNNKGSGKVYVNAESDTAIPSKDAIEAVEQILLKKLNVSLPATELPKWSGVVNPALYGIKTHSDFLNRRQRLLLLYLIDELVEQYEILSKENTNMGKFVMGILSSMIDQVVDWNCRLSMWIPQNEQVGRGFCGPGIAMLFDYAETDQLLHGPANLWDKLKRIVQGVKSFENCIGNVDIRHAHAQNLPFEDNFFDAIVTDPPYYDNIYYSILADFFYSWKKLLLQKIEPELFEKCATDYNYELVASSRRVKDGQSAHEEYCKQLGCAIKEAARVLKSDGVFTFVYSHSSVNGWEAVIRAYRQSKFFINSVQPLSIERKSRPRAVLSQAVNTCMALVSRKSDERKLPITLEHVLNKTQEYCKDFGKLLMEESGWAQQDAGLAVIACTVGLVANASKVIGAESDADALIKSSKIVKATFPEFTIKIRDSI